MPEDQVTASNQVTKQEDAPEQPIAAARLAGRQEAADAILAHAERCAPADGNMAQLRMRRHLHIAARIAAPLDQATIEAAAVDALHQIQHAEALADRYPGAVIEETSRG